MKKLPIITLFLVFLAQITCAQKSDESFNRSNTTYSNKSKVEVSLSPGFFLGGKLDNFKIGNSFDFTAAFSFALPARNAHIELSYTGAFPRGEIIHQDGHDHFNVQMKSYISYFQLGYLNYLMNGDFKPYWLFTVGAANLKSKTTRNKPDINPEEYLMNKWMFAFAAGAGLRYDINDKFAVKLQGRLLIPMLFASSGVGINIGSGGIYPSLNINSYKSIFQGDFSLGVIYKL